MSSYKNILIWIGVVSLIGVILLIVACETGVLFSRNKPTGDLRGVFESTTAEGLGADQNANPGTASRPQENNEDKKAEMLTIGDPYPERLVEEGTKNLLIIGQDKVNNLYDTIGIVSIDKKNKRLKFIMIPRDTYIEYNEDILSKMEAANLAKVAGTFKINFSHHVGSLIDYKGKFDTGPISFLSKVVEEKFGVETDDYIKINTSGFKKLVDLLGGVDIYVPYDMDYEDPTQDLYIHLTKGKQHLDGTGAEGFVRFRQGYRSDGRLFEIGDTGRKNNQITFMKELLKQKGTIKNVGKIPEIIDLLGKNVNHSIGLGDILQTYIGLSKAVISDEYEITSENLKSDRMTNINGASYLLF